MIGIERRLASSLLTFVFVELLGPANFAPPPALAAINLVGDVVSSSPVTDPWIVGGQLSIGETETGSMTVDAGSHVVNTDGYVGNNAGSDGTVAVVGALSTWSSLGELRMGNSGAGTLNIMAGGSVSVTGNARIGNVPGGVGTATVDGSGSTFTSEAYILVGREGNGTLTIQNGGLVSDLIGGVAIFEGSQGAVTVSGAGSAWNNLNELQVADGGSATLDILDGGAVSNGLGFIGVATDGAGTVTVSGAGSMWTISDQLQVGYGGRGTLNVTSGGTVSSPLGYLGSLAGGIGTVTVSGAGSTWTNSSDLQVGYDGSGTLNIQDGATVTSLAAMLGTNASGSGEATVEGAGSSWTSTGNLTIGSSGNGTLNIASGGLVSAAALAGGNATSRVNFNGGTLRITASGSSSNTIVLDGGATLEVPTADSTVTITGSISGDGGLVKTGAGTLTLTAANDFDGNTRISNGTLNISEAFLDDFADVYLAQGAVFGLYFPGTDMIDSLFIDGMPRVPGTYGAIGSGADFEMDLFAGSGLLEVLSPGVPGDFNDDGRVDAADHVVWRKIDGSADGFEIWRTNFGAVPGAGARSAFSSNAPSRSTAPEPESVLLVFIGGAAASASRRKAITITFRAYHAFHAHTIIASVSCVSGRRWKSP
jgi:T5SS/PEP-CTERM-associated repeat protein/autotransporter-associated beta strand protein